MMAPGGYLPGEFQLGSYLVFIIPENGDILGYHLKFIYFLPITLTCAQKGELIMGHHRILIVDDECVSLEMMTHFLEKLGHVPIPATGCAMALEIAGKQPIDMIITDLVMPEMDGFMLIDRIKGLYKDIPVIAVTANGSINNAVQAMRNGACDFLEKPYNIEVLQMAIQRNLNYFDALRENRKMKTVFQEKFRFQSITTGNPFMKEQLELAARVAASARTTVSLTGESGTGKEMFARAIHCESGCLPGSFVAVNCAAIPEALLESELFGHVRGAFTGADRERDGKFSLAKGGTVLLDEIGDMPLLLQAKLLRVIEERSFEKVGSNTPLPADFRVITATHRDLVELVRQGRFRDDLYHRINVVPIRIPPLRERREDIPLLTEHFIDIFRGHLGKSLPGVSKKAMSVLTGYEWPGNVRELRNVLEYAAIIASDELIRPEHLRINYSTIDDGSANTPHCEYHLSFSPEELSLDALTGKILEITLERCNGNKSKAAEILRVSRKIFYN
jgi:DNA-binding NtrC family response regulator